MATDNPDSDAESSTSTLVASSDEEEDDDLEQDPEVARMSRSSAKWTKRPRGHLQILHFLGRNSQKIWLPGSLEWLVERFLSQILAKKIGNIKISSIFRPFILKTRPGMIFETILFLETMI